MPIKIDFCFVIDVVFFYTNLSPAGQQWERPKDAILRWLLLIFVNFVSIYNSNFFAETGPRFFGKNFAVINKEKS